MNAIKHLTDFPLSLEIENEVFVMPEPSQKSKFVTSFKQKYNLKLFLFLKLSIFVVPAKEES